MVVPKGELTPGVPAGCAPCGLARPATAVAATGAAGGMGTASQFIHATCATPFCLWAGGLLPFSMLVWIGKKVQQWLDWVFSAKAGITGGKRKILV